MGREKGAGRLGGGKLGPGDAVDHMLQAHNLVGV